MLFGWGKKQNCQKNLNLVLSVKYAFKEISKRRICDLRVTDSYHNFIISCFAQKLEALVLEKIVVNSNAHIKSVFEEILRYFDCIFLFHVL